MSMELAFRRAGRQGSIRLRPLRFMRAKLTLGGRAGASADFPATAFWNAQAAFLREGQLSSGGSNSFKLRVLKLPAAARGLRCGHFMHWVAPTERDVGTSSLEKRLWDSADQFRANSGLKA
jgi:hypothetical protein